MDRRLLEIVPDNECYNTFDIFQENRFFKVKKDNVFVKIFDKLTKELSTYINIYKNCCNHPYYINLYQIILKILNLN